MVGEPGADGVRDLPWVMPSVGGGSGSASSCVTAVLQGLSPFSISKLLWSKRDSGPGPTTWSQSAGGRVPRRRATLVTL